VWADDYAIQKISNFCNVTFLIVNESARNIAQNIITPFPSQNEEKNNKSEKGDKSNKTNDTNGDIKNNDNRNNCNKTNNIAAQETVTEKDTNNKDTPPITSISSTDLQNNQPKQETNLSNDNPLQSEPKYIVLQLTRHMHYNLVGYKSKNAENYLFTKQTLPYSFATKFGIETSAAKKRDLESYLNPIPNKRKR
jgi:hypothetical protein